MFKLSATILFCVAALTSATSLRGHLGEHGFNKGHGSDKCLPQFKVCPHGFVEKFGGCYSFAEKHCPHGSVHKHGKCVFISTDFAKKVCKHGAKKCFPKFKVCPHGFHAKQFKCVKQATKFVHKVCPHGFTLARHQALKNACVKQTKKICRRGLKH